MDGDTIREMPKGYNIDMLLEDHYQLKRMCEAGGLPPPASPIKKQKPDAGRVVSITFNKKRRSTLKYLNMTDDDLLANVLVQGGPGWERANNKEKAQMLRLVLKEML